MKKILFIVSFLVSIAISAQIRPIEMSKAGVYKNVESSISSVGFSPKSAFLLLELNKLEKEDRTIQKTDTHLIKEYNLFIKNDILYLNAFLTVSDQFNKSALENKGGFINSSSINIRTASIPVNTLKDIIKIEGVEYIEIAEKVDFTMDAARSATYVNSVHQGLQLQQSYYGSGVVVGIIDIGFDYTHPNFYDENGSGTYRIKRVWEQNTNSGTQPTGFTYGRELADQNAILNAQRDFDNASHGTHVAGIAAGGGASLSSLKGVAPKSDLVLVSTNSSDAGIADGISYIFNYAKSVNKPCVINISLGKHIGPHDGTSALDKFCDGVVGSGKVLVGAAGNDGSSPIFLTKAFSSYDTVVMTFLKINNATFTNKNNGSGVIDIWGRVNETFWVSMAIYNTKTNQYETWTSYESSNSNTTSQYKLKDNDPLFPDECSIKISAEIFKNNNKPRIQIEVDNTNQDDDYRWVTLTIFSRSNETKMWGGPDNRQAFFSRLTYNYPVIEGIMNSTIREIGGTGNNIISVGAYTAKNAWISYSNISQAADFYVPIGAIAPFSSLGPTADGRTKPDITAPGNVIASSVSRFDTKYSSTSRETVTGVTNGVNTWWFSTMQGTSMASPMVTGILALWLEAYPHLTPTQAKQILKDNAITDTYTGTIPSSGSNTWGWGKIDAHKGLLGLLSKIPAAPSITPSGNVSFCQGQSAVLSTPGGFSKYQWSNSAVTQNITITNTGSYSVRVTNSQGYISPWSGSKNVTVYQNPPTPLASNTCNLLLSSSASGNQWYFNGNVIPGATQQTYNATQNGNYYVVVTNANNCSSISNTVSITSTGIHDMGTTNFISVYPNPASNQLNINFSEQQRFALIEMFDVTGRLNLKKLVKDIPDKSTEIMQIEDFKAGVYILKISMDRGQSSIRIIKE